MKEEEFWNKLAERLKDAPFRLGTYESYALKKIGKLKGQRVLDCGVGVGKSSALLSQKGAFVFGFDISLAMLKIAKKRVAEIGLGEAERKSRIAFLQMKAENIGFKDRQFDAIFGIHLLHHTHISESIPEIARVLKKGGRGVFVENFGFNPLLNFSRTHLVDRFDIPRYGTTEEHPLTRKDLCAIRSHFKKVELTVPDFLFMRLLAQQVFRFKFRPINFICKLFDQWILKGFTNLAHSSYTQLLILEK